MLEKAFREGRESGKNEFLCLIYVELLKLASGNCVSTAESFHPGLVCGFTFRPLKNPNSIKFCCWRRKAKKGKVVEKCQVCCSRNSEGERKFSFCHLECAVEVSRKSRAVFDIESFPQGLHRREQDELMKLTSFQLAGKSSSLI